MKLSSIGTEIRGIAEWDMPLTEVATSITTGQLEQAVWFERAVLAGETKNVDLMRRAEHEFENLAKKVNGIFKKGEKLAEKAIADAETESNRKEFQEVSAHLRQLETQHSRYDEHVGETFRLLNAGNLRGALQMSHKVEREGAKLNHEVEAFLKQLVTFTVRATLKAEHDEATAIRLAIVVTLVSLVIGIFMGIFTTRAVLRQIGGEPAEIAVISRRIAEGDLTVDIQAKNGKQATGILSAMQAMVAKLREVVNGVQEATGTITSAAEEMSQGNTDLSQRTEEQASNLEETASSMEEMTSTVKQNADNARQANQLAANARDQAEKGSEVVGNAVTAMGEINTSSKKIADIIGTIDEIAFQTNLLALNAAVEAARAGEQGRGFAVVASEVRTLAGRSADAAKEIKDLINDSVGKVEQGAELVDASGKTLDEIVESVKKVTDIISEIAASSQEQATGIEQVNTAVMQMDEMTQQNAALVEEASAASKSMEEQAILLSEQVAFFNIGSEARQMNVARHSRPTAVQQAPVERHAAHQAVAVSARPKPQTQNPAMKAVKDEGDDWSEF